MRIFNYLMTGAAAACLAVTLVQVAGAQDASRSQANQLPHLVSYNGSVPVDAAGAPVGLVFSLYEQQAGGDPVWMEAQTVTPDAKGRYAVLLGAATEGGLPQAAFSSAQARWLGVSLENGTEQSRTILVATPYSLKASDAETLGGHPASDFALVAKDIHGKPETGGTDITSISGSNGVLVNSVASSSGTGPSVALSLDSSYLQTLGNSLYALKSNAVTSVTGSNGVTVTGSGNTYTASLNDTYLLQLAAVCCAQLSANNVMTGTNTFSKPIVFATGQAFPGTALLASANSFSATQTLAAATAATASAGTDSSALAFAASAWNSSSGSAQNVGFLWQAEPVANDTANTTASMNLLYQGGTNKAAETGLSVASDGQLTFATGQTFPNTINGVSASTPLTVSDTGGSVVLGLNTGALETTLNAVYPLLSGTNTFTGAQNITGNESITGTLLATATTSGSPITGVNNSTTAGVGVQGVGLTGTLGFGIGTDAVGVQGTATNTGGIGVSASGNSTSGTGVTASGAVGVYGFGTNFGVEGHVSGSAAGEAGVEGISASGSGSGIYGYVGSPSTTGSGTTSGAAVWADSNLGSPNVALRSTGDNNNAVYAENNSSSGFSALYAENLGSGGALHAVADGAGAGVAGSSVSGYGIEGASTSSQGVYGVTSGTGGPAGIFGLSNATTVGSDGYPGIGISGNAGGPSSWGVYGNSTDSHGIGIYGNVNGIYATGVKGLNYSAYGNAMHATTGGSSTYGSSFGNNYGFALWADTSEGHTAGTEAALLASADNNYAAYIVNDSTSYPALYVYDNGLDEISSFPAVYNTVALIGGAKGDCIVDAGGDFSCSGEVSDVVPAGDGAVEMYAVHSTENWYEDFGTAKLVNGKTTVAIDAKFAKVINADVQYHVFLTPHGDSEGLYVSRLGPVGFEVHESRGGASSIEFDYRIVAKRSGHEKERMTDATARLHDMMQRPEARAGGRPKPALEAGQQAALPTTPYPLTALTPSADRPLPPAGQGRQKRAITEVRTRAEQSK